MSTLVALAGLRKAYGPRQALSDLSLTVEEGEVLGLLGPNGAGKSTTMNIIAGLCEADAGEARLFGDRSPRDPEARALLGFAPQELALYRELTAEENLRFFGGLFGRRGRDLTEKVDRALVLAGLWDRRADRVKTFSGGMARRLNLACAVVHGPRLVLLDEPTVGVDPQSRAHLLDSLKRLRQDGMTVVYSTHYMEEAATLCDRIAIVDEGRVRALGTLSELIAQFGTIRPKPVQGADLETVFLNLTGRSLRD